MEDDEPSTEEILPKLSEVTPPDFMSFGDSFESFIAARQARRKLIVKRRRPSILYSDSEEEEEEEQENEEGDEGQGRVRGNDKGRGRGNSGDEDTMTDRDAGLGDEDEVITELDSDYDF